MLEATMWQEDLKISVGKTDDFEFGATAPVKLPLDGVRPNDTRRVVQFLAFTDLPRRRSPSTTF